MNPWILALLLSTNTADGLSTCAALNHHAREANPIFAHCSSMIVMKAGMTTVDLWAAYHLHATGHRKAEKWLGVALAGLEIGVASHNVSVIYTMKARGF